MLSAGCMRWPRRGVVEVRGGMERAVRTPDGRTLAVEDAGDPGGRPVLVHEGTPARGTRTACGWPMPPSRACG